MPFPYDDSNDIIKKPKLLDFFRREPGLATVCGYHEFDDKLPHADENALNSQRKYILNWGKELTSIPKAQLSPAQILDVELFNEQVAMHSFFFDEIQNWKRGTNAVTEVGQLCFLKLLYRDESDATLFEHIAARLEGMNQYVTEHKSRVANPPRRWVDISMQTVSGMPLLFEAIAAAASKANLNETELKRVRSACDSAIRAAEDYKIYLKDLSVDESESWALGPENFEKLLQLRGIGLDSAEILELGEQYLARYKEERIILAKEISGTNDLKKAKAVVESAAPADFASALEATRNACKESREFLRNNNLLDLPDGEELRIMETPTFLRPLIPFAAIFPPAHFARPQKGIYLVTPPHNPEDLARHLNFTSIYNTAVHEGYPGHHLQLSRANLECSIVRSMPLVAGKATDLVEGWAHYCEEMMKEHGLRNNLVDRFVMVSDLVWRATRIIVDVKLSRGEMSFDEAVQMLIDNAHMPKANAISEVNRYTQSPGYQLSYLIGKHQILELKKAVKLKEGAKYSESSFHNRLIGAGNIPVTFIRKNIFCV